MDGEVAAGLDLSWLAILSSKVGSGHGVPLPALPPFTVV